MANTQIVKINRRHLESSVFEHARRVLSEGGLIVFPTETVYGIAVNLLNVAAVQRLRDLKARPGDKPFTIHISDRVDVDRYAVDVLPRAHKLMNMFWPGPLTLILAAPSGKSVGLRFPSDPVARAFLGGTDFPVGAPSANLTGGSPAVDVEGVAGDLIEKVDLILDAGPTQLSRESTIVDARQLPFSILRRGALSDEEINRVADRKTVLFVCTGNSCRSVMAEYLLKRMTMDRGRDDIDSISAGTMAFFGMGASWETQRLVKELGFDAGHHHSQKVTLDLARAADYIFAMERHHKEELVRAFPTESQRIFLLNEFAGLTQEGADIADPIGRSEDFYLHCYDRIRKAVENILEKI